jgi:hypothetical protein
LDLVTLKDLPLPLAVIIAAFWVINSNNAEFAKKLVALIAEFTSKYEALLKAVTDERQASSDRWLERDRQLIETLNRNTEAHVKNANETHTLRNLVQPLVLSVEAERRRSRGSRGTSGGGQDAAG